MKSNQIRASHRQASETSSMTKKKDNMIPPAEQVLRFLAKNPDFLNQLAGKDPEKRVADGKIVDLTPAIARRARDEVRQLLELLHHDRVHLRRRLARLGIRGHLPFLCAPGACSLLLPFLCAEKAGQQPVGWVSSEMARASVTRLRCGLRETRRSAMPPPARPRRGPLDCFFLLWQSSSPLSLPERMPGFFLGPIRAITREDRVGLPSREEGRLPERSMKLH